MLQHIAGVVSGKQQYSMPEVLQRVHIGSRNSGTVRGGTLKVALPGVGSELNLQNIYYVYLYVGRCV